MKIVKVIFLFVSMAAFAQTKTGTIDVDFILSKMPEMTQVQQDITTYGQSLDGELKIKMEGYTKFVDDYKKGEASFTEAVRKERQDSIISLENEITKFQQNGSKLMSIKRDDILRPLYTKIGASLDKIAKQQNYTQIFQLTDNVAYFDKTYDLTYLILADMGIEVPKE